MAYNSSRDMLPSPEVSSALNNFLYVCAVQNTPAAFSPFPSSTRDTAAIRRESGQGQVDVRREREPPMAAARVGAGQGEET